jgi:hypothetical protein
LVAPGRRAAAARPQIKDAASAVDIPVSSKPYYLLGREAELSDFVVDDANCSRLHAALVHHADGRSFIIDLASVSLGGAAAPAPAPAAWDGAQPGMLNTAPAACLPPAQGHDR